MGKVSKGVKCCVDGCNSNAEVSLSEKELSRLNLPFKVNPVGRRIYLCREHYKVVKKELKKLRRLEKWRWSR